MLLPLALHIFNRETQHVLLSLALHIFNMYSIYAIAHTSLLYIFSISICAMIPTFPATAPVDLSRMTAQCCLRPCKIAFVVRSSWPRLLYRYSSYLYSSRLGEMSDKKTEHNGPTNPSIAAPFFLTKSILWHSSGGGNFKKEKKEVREWWMLLPWTNL